MVQHTDYKYANHVEALLCKYCLLSTLILCMLQRTYFSANYMFQLKNEIYVNEPPLQPMHVQQEEYQGCQNNVELIGQSNMIQKFV